MSNGGPWNPKLTLKVNGLWIKIKAQNFASQVLSKHTFKIWRKKGSGVFDHRGTLTKGKECVACFSRRSSGRNAWRIPKSVCVGGYKCLCPITTVVIVETPPSFICLYCYYFHVIVISSPRGIVNLVLFHVGRVGSVFSYCPYRLVHGFVREQLLRTREGFPIQILCEKNAAEYSTPKPTQIMRSGSFFHWRACFVR